MTQSNSQLSISFGSITAWTLSAGAPTVTVGVWQLIGFTGYISANKKTNEGTMFAGTTSRLFANENAIPTMDLSTATVMRIGGATGSFPGSISAVRVMSPGGGVIRTSK